MIIYVSQPKQNQIVLRWIFIGGTADCVAIRTKTFDTFLSKQVQEIVNRQSGIGVFVHYTNEYVLNPAVDEVLLKYIYKDFKFNSKTFTVSDSD